MEIVDCKSFDDFKEKFRQLKLSIQADPLMQTRYYFRGHANSEWKLESTLLRHSNKSYNRTSYSLELYNHLYKDSRLEWSRKYVLENFKAKNKLVKLLDEYDKIDSIVPFYIQEIGLSWIEARQFGIPSPLLDWTTNLDIALWFALSTPFIGDVALFVYKFNNDNKELSGQDSHPLIYRLDPIGSEKINRHFKQEAIYTVCAIHNDSNNRFAFISHEEHFEKNPKLAPSLFKFIIPGSDRVPVLQMLDEKGINRNYLFGE